MKLPSLLFALLLFALAGRSRADGDAPAATSGGATARDHYDEAVRHYNLAEYDRAIEAFKEAYRLSPAPSVLFNIAQSYRQNGPSGCAQALVFYRSYLRERPGAADRAAVEARITEMAACAAAQANATGTSGPAAPPPLRSGPTRAQFALGGAGLALTVTGAALFGVAAAKYQSLTHECPCDRTRWLPYRGVEISSYVAFAVGGAAFAAGMIWWLATRHHPKLSALPTATLRFGVAF